MTNIGVLSQIAHVANDQRLHSCLLQRGDESACLLVLDILDLGRVGGKRGAISSEDLHDKVLLFR